MLALGLTTIVHTPHATTSQTTSKKNVLVIGDSLSAEYGLQRGTGWVELIAQRLQERHPEYQIQNSSISGDTTRGGVSRLPDALDTYKPSIVILELGANDALRGLPLEATRENLNHMINMVHQTGARVLLVGMQIPPNYGRTYTRQFQQLFPDLAQETGSALVPFLLEGIAADLGFFQSDAIHPNEKAQPVLADTVWSALAPMLQP